MFIFVIVKILIIQSALLGVIFVDQALSLFFNFSEFTDSNSDQILYINSYPAFGAIQVTPEPRSRELPIANEAGRAFFKHRYNLWNDESVFASFNTTFVLNIQNQTSHGGEGVAFVLTAEKTLPDFSSGAWLGVVNSDSNGSPQAQIVAIEFDTRKSYDKDLDDNHVGLDINSIESRRQFSLSSFGVNLLAGNDVKITVRYDGQSKNLSLYLAQMASPVFRENIDLSAYLPKKVFVGFSASTSDETQLNCIRSWEFNGTDIRIDDEKKSNLVWIAVPLLGVFILFVVVIAVSIYWKRKLEPEDTYPSIEEAIRGSSTAPRKFKLKELKKATGNFNPKNKLGKGGFGTVFKGVMGNKEVAVKQFSDKSSQGKTEFIAEVTTIGNLRHRNLVKLIGWCYERGQFLLVYEYLPNRSLDKFIFTDEKSPESFQESTLGWEKRRHVLVEAAQALDYLHNGCEDTILHRDIKSSNIMLDSEFSAKLGDFGLARTMNLSNQTHHSTNEIAGTPGYMAPESILMGRFTVETDIYAFGVLILEVASGRRPGCQNRQDNYSSNIMNRVWECHRNGRITDVADLKLKGEFEALDMECILVLGLACCQPNPNKRPSMKNVLHVLKGEAPAPIVPTERPTFMWPPLPLSLQELDISLGQITMFPNTEYFSVQ